MLYNFISKNRIIILDKENINTDLKNSIKDLNEITTIMKQSFYISIYLLPKKMNAPKTINNKNNKKFSNREENQKKKINNPPTKTNFPKNDNNINYNQDEILSEINTLKKELESRSTLINNLITEVNKQNLALKDYEILERTKNDINALLLRAQEENENLKSQNANMKEELNKINLEKEEFKKLSKI